jgi:hypothetical protein
MAKLNRMQPIKLNKTSNNKKKVLAHANARVDGLVFLD